MKKVVLVLGLLAGCDQLISDPERVDQLQVSEQEHKTNLADEHKQQLENLHQRQQAELAKQQLRFDQDRSDLEKRHQKEVGQLVRQSTEANLTLQQEHDGEALKLQQKHKAVIGEAWKGHFRFQGAKNQKVELLEAQHQQERDAMQQRQNDEKKVVKDTAAQKLSLLEEKESRDKSELEQRQQVRRAELQQTHSQEVQDLHKKQQKELAPEEQKQRTVLQKQREGEVARMKKDFDDTKARVAVLDQAAQAKVATQADEKSAFDQMKVKHQEDLARMKKAQEEQVTKMKKAVDNYGKSLEGLARKHEQTLEGEFRLKQREAVDQWTQIMQKKSDKELKKRRERIAKDQKKIDDMRQKKKETEVNYDQLEKDHQLIPDTWRSKLARWWQRVIRHVGLDDASFLIKKLKRMSLVSVSTEEFDKQLKKLFKELKDYPGEKERLIELVESPQTTWLHPRTVVGVRGAVTHDAKTKITEAINRAMPEN